MSPDEKPGGSPGSKRFREALKPCLSRPPSPRPESRSARRCVSTRTERGGGRGGFKKPQAGSAEAGRKAQRPGAGVPGSAGPAGAPHLGGKERWLDHPRSPIPAAPRPGCAGAGQEGRRVAASPRRWRGTCGDGARPGSSLPARVPGASMGARRPELIRQGWRAVSRSPAGAWHRPLGR